MNPDHQRIAIAEASGYVLKQETSWPYRRSWIKFNHKFIKADLPEYLEDRNAMHKAVLGLKLHQRDTYCMELRRIVMRDHKPEMLDPDSKLCCDVYFYEAEIEQCAEAFLITVGKWDDKKQPTAEERAQLSQLLKE